MKAKLILLLCAVCAFSACTKQANDEDKLALARDAFRASYSGHEQDVLTAMYANRLDHLSAEQRAKVEAFIAEQSKILTEAVEPIFVEAFAEVYTVKELQAMKAYHESPEGRSVFEKRMLLRKKLDAPITKVYNDPDTAPWPKVDAMIKEFEAEKSPHEN